MASFPGHEGEWPKTIWVCPMCGAVQVRPHCQHPTIRVVCDPVEVVPVQPGAEKAEAIRERTKWLDSQECAVVLHHREADALLAMLEAANNAGMKPGIGLRVEDARAAGFKIVGERFRDQEPYNRAPRIVAAVFLARLDTTKGERE